MNGILIVDKPAGWTSQDVVSKLRGLYHERRIGHGGTLDPMATGVLPVFLGRATRGVTFFESAEKEYLADLRLGLTTDTQDTTGTVLATHECNVTRQQLEAVLRQFEGPIQQIPPMYSAVKVGGKKLYELARQGKEVERKPRDITIFALELLNGSGADWRIRVHCSKGTYVRSLCQQIGDALGCGGCMAGLRRIRAGTYTIDEAIGLQQLIDMSAEEREACLRPVDSLFCQNPACHVTEKAVRCIRNGRSVPTPSLADGTYRVYGPEGEFLSLSRVEGGVMRTIRSFFEVNKG